MATDLFSQETDASMAGVAAVADDHWIDEARYRILMLRPGHRFIGEDIVERLAGLGLETPDARAMGPVLKRLAAAGAISKTGDHRPARSSHGSPKPVWERL